MRLSSFHVGSGREAGAEATLVVELFARDGSRLAPDREDDAAYVLERLRQGSDLSVALKPR